nr:hypothetical protein [Tanacetum cinerariifolium]
MCDDQEMFDISVLDDEEEVLLKEAQDVQNVVEKVIKDITTTGVEETVSTAAPITMAQTLVEIKKSKPKGDKVVKEQEPEQGAITTTITTTIVTIPTPDSTRPKAKGVVMQEPSKTVTTTTIPISLKVQDKGKGIMVEEPLKMKNKYQIYFDEQEARRLQAEIDKQDRLAKEKSQQIKDENLAWDNVQAMMDADYELAARLQEKEQGELNVKENSRLFVELMDKRKKHFTKLRAEVKRRKPLTKAQKKN